MMISKRIDRSLTKIVLGNTVHPEKLGCLNEKGFHWVGKNWKKILIKTKNFNDCVISVQNLLVFRVDEIIEFGFGKKNAT